MSKQLTPKELADLTKPAVWKRMVFWNNVQRTCAVIGGPSVVGFHMFDAADFWVIFSGAVTTVGAVLAIWMTDGNKNEIVDIFEK